MAVTAGWTKETNSNNYDKAEEWLTAKVISVANYDSWSYRNYYTYSWQIMAKVEGKSVTLVEGWCRTQLLCSQCADAVLAAILKTSPRCKSGCHVYLTIGEDMNWPNYPKKASKPSGNDRFRYPKWVLIETPVANDGTILCVASNSNLHPDGSAHDLKTGKTSYHDPKALKEDLKGEPKQEKGLPLLREWEM